MGGDYTRWTFDPVKDYAELFKQQGRVDLDADWNEFVEIVYRRWRSETVDIIGRAVVPESTPSAFFITPSGPSMFTIGIGRMYVDGLLAECHGLKPLIFDPILGELDGTLPVPFNAQPYYPNPNPLPSPGPAVDLVCLDVWQREVIALQDPNIREKALGGPDTTTRMQTAWQVKILPGVGAHACGDDIPAWDTLIAPSAGRLSTSTVVPAPSPDPCILSPTGGYRGLENRLYRVEVHTAGTVGGTTPATFKWSRDNGSVVSGVNAISAPGGPNSVVTLTSLGRDQVLRFKAGDWVEILDDPTEFAENDFDGIKFVGKPGFLTQISTPPDEANRTITVVPAIPAGRFDPTNPSRHTRVRRWDQSFTGAGSDVDPGSGLITVSAGPLDIEDGIQVSFSDDPAGGLLHVGDYWLFAARTADGSVELLQKAPPRGILHHYARLGFITWAAGGTGSFSDCRQFWPPTIHGNCNGCCTVTVGDGVYSQGDFINDIQGAINALGPEGGEVCLGRGVFIITEGIVVGAGKRNIIIRGMGWATKLIFAPDAQAGSRVLFDIQKTSHVTLESFFAVARSAQSMVRITSSEFCEVRDTALINLNISAAPLTAFLGFRASAEINVSGRAIELLETCFDTQIERNTLIASKAIVSGTSGVSTGVGAISGTVLGLLLRGVVPLADATVVLTDVGGITKRATTDPKGQFAFSSLPAGNYNLSASFQGFKTATQSVTVAANETAVVTFRLALGNATTVSSMDVSSISAVSSNANQIRIRENRILALLSSIFLVRTEDCDIIANQLLGLDAQTIKTLQAGELNRNTIDTFQQTVMSVLTTGVLGMAFQGAAIVLLSGARVTVAENLITGLLGMMAIFLSAARIRDNQILSLLALLVVDGLVIRVTGNLIAGIYAGCMHVGLLVDFVCDSNVWLGFYGLTFLPLSAFQKTVAPLLSGALESAGFATSGGKVIDNVLQAITQTGASLNSLSLVALVKIHHELFFTFSAGVLCQPAVDARLGIISGDIVISDSSFEFCTQAGVSWFSTPPGKNLGTLLPANHVVERNTMNVKGVGVRCLCVDGVFENNAIRCSSLGIDLICFSGRVQKNQIDGTGTEATSNGLITVAPLSLVEGESSFEVIGNRMQGGQGYGIFVAGNLGRLVVDDNLISGMAQSGIATMSTAILQMSRVCRNTVLNCKAGRATPPFDGAIILWEVQNDLMVQDNQLFGNAGIGMNLNVNGPWENQTLRMRVLGNSMDGTVNTPMIDATGALIQFIGNQCSQGETLLNAVTLRGQFVVADANTVYSTQPIFFGAPSLLLIALPFTSLPASAIATSNVLHGSPLNSGFLNFVAGNNISLF